MMKTRSFLNRTAALALVLTMLVPFLPVFDSAAKAAAEGVNYVSLPITIRDYADDGMLFEYSDADSIGSGGTTIFGGDASVTPSLKMKNSTNTNTTFSMTENTAYIRYTVTGSGSYITWKLSDYYREDGYTRNDLRYAAIKYKTNAAYSSYAPTIGHRASDGDHYVNFSTAGYGKSDFTYVVIDLGGGSATVNYVTLFPQLTSSNYIDIGYVAFFETAAEASAYNSLQQNGASEVGNTYHMGNNMLYGLLMPNRATMDYTKSTHTMNPNGDVDAFMHSYLGAIQPGSSSESSYGNITSVDIPGGDLYRALVWSKYYNVEGAKYLDVTLENGARQQLHGGRARVGLVEPSISASSKNLVYKQKVVDYLAWVLEKSLAVPEKNADGSYNYNFVQGEKLAELGNKDLATVLRENINGGTGTYSDAKSRFNSGALVHPADCDTYYEAAYFLLHSTFTTNTGYGKALNNPYHELQLIETTNAAGEVCYKFSSAYTETAYDSTNGLIYNTQQVNAPGNVSGWGYGMTTYDNHFNPIPNDGYGITGSKALDISGYGTNAELYGRNNYNLSLEGHAQFVYREDANQYFTFTGDDDVYLFINNELAVDLGGAHAISEVTIQLKDVAATCGLVDGGVYDFDFYYMERHGTAANFAIETNIQIADPSMVTTKTGYQNGSEVGYNGFIDPALPVNYQFTLQNNGAAALENLTFSDPKLNTYLSADSITLNSETTWSDLLLAHYNADGTGGTANEWVDNGDGTHSFPNVVYTTAKVENADRILNGQADYVVRKQSVTIDSFHLYSWGNNVVQDDGTAEFVLNSSVNITYAEAIDPIIKAYQRDGLTVPHLTGGTVAITNASGNPDSTAVNPRATVDDENGISHAAAGTGMDSYYYVVTNADNVKYGPVHVDVYTYAVIDVSVQTKDDSGNWQEYTYKPVITESKGGDLYQVPIISITGLPHDTYRVVVNAAGERVIKGETISRILYIDGIRIYGPLSDEKALDYYNPEEYQAEFFEVKQLIEDGSAIYADISNTGDELLLMAGDTVIEDTTGSGLVLTTAADVDEYMSFGPNNELYLDPTSTTTVIAFFLTPDENVPESARTIEIGAHRKADSATESNGYVDLVYGSTANVFIDAFDNETANYKIYSGTEQYYTVDVKDLVLGDDGRYLVMIGAVSNENLIEVLAFTSLKIAGYEIEFAAPAMEMSDFDPDEGLPNTPNTALGEVKKYYSYVAPKVERPTETMPGTEEPEAPEPEAPEQEEPVAAVNEALTVDSAALKAANVVSGKAASLAVKSSTLAAEAVVYDANGEQVELKKANRTEKDGVVTFTLVFTVTGERGQVLDFTVQLLDAEGLVSANTETVSVTIK
ncbi:MAG: fibro-slime domain-containing protein [Clostridia bacterium]|nr:fibro-slime domain-containing protein [Clostridia bacterium]